MIVVKPIAIIAASLTSSNVAENDAAVWAAGTYTLGQQRIYNHRLYQVAIASTTDQPDTGAALTPTPSWIDLGATNRYKMFDGIIGSATSNSGTVQAVITTSAPVNAVGLFGCTGKTANVTLTDPVLGVVYSRTVPLQDNAGITNWYAYFFYGVTPKYDVVFLDVPQYGSATVTITVDALSGTAVIGEAVLGLQKMLGTSNYGTSVSTDDYSVKTRDTFGNFTIVERTFNKRGDFDVTVETTNVSFVQRFLATIRATACIYIGDESKESTIIYGFYRRFNIVIGAPSISQCNIEVEGLT